MDMMLEFCNRGIKNYDLFESAVCHEESFGNGVDKTAVLEKNIVATINTKLERIESHLQGLNLLYQFLPKISKESLTNNFPRWISKVTQILNNTHDSSVEIVCQTTGALVAKCKTIPDLDKSVSINNVKHIIKIIVQRYDQVKDGALINLLTVLLYHYPESCARLQGQYNKIITSCIDDVNDELVITGAKCYSLLVRALERLFVHSSKNEAIIFPENISASCHVSHQIDLCNNLCNILDEVFQDLVSVNIQMPNITQTNTRIINLELTEISRHDLIDYYRAVQHRFTNICIYLSTLLKIGGNGRRKYGLPNVILQVICKGLAITPSNLQKNDEEENRKDFLTSILPGFHISLLNVLGDLINSFQQELLPFAFTIQRLIVQTLEWTQKHYKPFKDIRLLTYKILTIWLKQTGSLSGFQLVADEFLPHILKDLSPPNKRIIVLSTKARKNAKHKSKAQKSHDAQNGNDCDEDSQTSYYSDMDLCSQVLSTIQAVITNANSFLKQSFYIQIRDAITLPLLDRYTNKNSFPVSSENTEYRLQLLKTLRVLLLHPHTLTPPPAAIAIKIFSQAKAQEEEPDIIEEAKLGLAELRHIVYPSAPSLMLPVFEPTASSRPSSPMEIVEQQEIVVPSRMKRSYEAAKDETSNLLEPPKRPKANEPTSTDAAFVPVKPLEPVTLESGIPNVEISASVEISQTVVDVREENEIHSNGISSATTDLTSTLKATDVNDKNETDDDMLMSFCDETA